MARSANQKLKLAYLERILAQRTDEEHPMTLAEIASALEEYGVSAERKSLYDDFEALRLIGVDVCQVREYRQTGYFLASRDFELAELKLLVDIVQANKFITERKTLELIKKLEGLCSRYEAQQMRRQVYVANRVKSMNESVYYNVDRLHEGISKNRQISFRYFNYAVTKQRTFRRGGGKYVVSPYALACSEENYYLIAHDSEAGRIKHYRVDKMEQIELREDAREGAEVFAGLDMAAYSRSSFSMYGGRTEQVTLELQNHLAGVVIDRFGRDVTIVRSDAEHFRISVPVTVSPQFFGWLLALGSEARLVGPPAVAGEFAAYLDGVRGMYAK